MEAAVCAARKACGKRRGPVPRFVWHAPSMVVCRMYGEEYWVRDVKETNAAGKSKTLAWVVLEPKNRALAGQFTAHTIESVRSHIFRA